MFTLQATTEVITVGAEGLLYQPVTPLRTEHFSSLLVCSPRFPEMRSGLSLPPLGVTENPRQQGEDFSDAQVPSGSCLVPWARPELPVDKTRALSASSSFFPPPALTT